MLTYAMDRRGDLPLYEYLYRCIRQDILNGTLTADERLPSKRALAEHLQLSVITVESAYQQLEAEGYVYTRPKRGFFVSAVERAPMPTVSTPIPAAATPRRWRLDLRSNQVDGSRFPAAAWARLTRQVLSETGEAFLAPVPHQGLLSLRQAIADETGQHTVQVPHLNAPGLGGLHPARFRTGGAGQEISQQLGRCLEIAACRPVGRLLQLTLEQESGQRIVGAVVCR